jgi:predicted glutamine amidotransferase
LGSLLNVAMGERLMCRWIAYSGAPTFIQDVIGRPQPSVVAKVADADGAGEIGLAWYGELPQPGLYRTNGSAITDAEWRRMIGLTQSDLFLAQGPHRAGRVAGETYPVVFGNWSLVLNNEIEGQAAPDGLVPRLLRHVRKPKSETATLVEIALAEGLREDPRGALLRTVDRLAQVARETRGNPALRLAVGFSDGQMLHALRYSTDALVPALHHRLSDDRDGRILTSGLAADERAGWTEVPSGSFCTFDGTYMEIEAFQPNNLVRAA